MSKLSRQESKVIDEAHNGLRTLLLNNALSLELRDDFEKYTAIRRYHGDRHLNQAFDPEHVKFGKGDFWLLAENSKGEAIATYCLRRFSVNDFFDVIRSLTLWSHNPSNGADPRFAVACKIPPFGGEVVHGGGLWIRNDYRGHSRLAVLLPRLARIFALRQRSFDHDSAMIRNNPAEPTEVAERKATFVGTKVYGFARVHRFVDGWFPPEGRDAIMHLCHATRAEIIASLPAWQIVGERSRRGSELGKLPFVNQHYQVVHTPAILSEWQQQSSI
jgi:hypothetical protein